MIPIYYTIAIISGINHIGIKKAKVRHIPRLAISATGTADATDTNPPPPIHHRPSGYQIDSNKLEKFQRPLREGSIFFMHAVQ